MRYNLHLIRHYNSFSIMQESATKSTMSIFFQRERRIFCDVTSSRDVILDREYPQNWWIGDPELLIATSTKSTGSSNCLIRCRAKFQSAFPTSFLRYVSANTFFGVNHFLPGRFPLKSRALSHTRAKRDVSCAKIKNKINSVLRI